MTDAFLLIGILDPGRFAGGALPLDADLAREAFERSTRRSTSASASPTPTGWA